MSASRANRLLPSENVPNQGQRGLTELPDPLYPILGRMSDWTVTHLVNFYALRGGDRPFKAQLYAAILPGRTISDQRWILSAYLESRATEIWTLIRPTVVVIRLQQAAVEQLTLRQVLTPAQLKWLSLPLRPHTPVPAVNLVYRIIEGAHKQVIQRGLLTRTA